MAREIVYGTEAREKLKTGIDAVANAVKVTLGAKGRNVIIQQDFGAPHITKDGVTVAKNITLVDTIENMGAEMMKEVAFKAVNEAGDGTTTAIVLAQAIIKEGLKNVAAGTNPMDLKRGIDKAVAKVVTMLSDLAEEVGTDYYKIEQIATISANNDPVIGEIIADAMVEVSVDGVITVEEAKGSETYVEVVEGTQFINGMLSPYFVTNPDKMTSELENPLILLYGKKVSSTKEILVAIEMGLRTGRPLVIIADDYEGEVIHTLVQNRVSKGFQISAVKSPSFGDKRKNLMEDLAILTGGTVISEEKGLSMDNFVEDYFGSAEKVIMSQSTTTIVRGDGDKEAIDERVKQLKHQIEISKQEWDDRETKSRITKLAGGVAVLYVGATTEVEMKEKKDRIDDALAATRAAIEEGVVAGGGIALLDIAKRLDVETLNRDESVGVEIVRTALEAPFRQIIINSGEEVGVIMSKILNQYPLGYNAKDEVIVDLISAGIIDPKKVTRIALESAASISSLVLTTEVTISNLKKE